MVKNTIIIMLTSLFLIACVGNATLPQKVTQVEASFSSAVSLLNDARRPCVEISETAPNCHLKADVYVKVVPIVHGIDSALDKARTFADTNQTGESEKWLTAAKRLLNEELKKYLDPIKKILGG